MTKYVLCGRCDMMGKETLVEIDESDWGGVWCEHCLDQFVENGAIMQDRMVRQVRQWQERRY